MAEDLARYTLDDRHLTEQLKQLRHELAQLFANRENADDRLAARNVVGDVGTTVSTPAEYERADEQSIWTANFRRLQQALRTLEEVSKCSSPRTAMHVEQLRYRSYTIEKAAFHTRRGLARWADCHIYALLDGNPDMDSFDAQARRLVIANVDVIQLRDKSGDDRRLLAQARILVRAAADTPTRVIINDRPDVAALSRADGVHLGQEDMAVHDARTILGPRPSIGVSTHSIAQARQAVMDGADYLGVGPVFSSTTKHFSNCAGLDFVRQVSQEINLPAFAIGGIAADNIDQVQAAGASRVAVCGALRGGDAAETVSALRHALGIANAGPSMPLSS